MARGLLSTVPPPHIRMAVLPGQGLGDRAGQLGVPRQQASRIARRAPGSLTHRQTLSVCLLPTCGYCFLRSQEGERTFPKSVLSQLTTQFIPKDESPAR